MIAAPLPPVDAYRLWSASYDDQPDNLVLRLEEELFASLLAGIPLAGRTVLDVGCGTGRHWPRLQAGQPRALGGVDSSPEMLGRLRSKFPGADVRIGDADVLSDFADSSVDVIVSTLTLGHIRDAAGAFEAWRRLLAPSGDLVVTDFHPEAFRGGMKRTFVHGERTFEAENHLHPLEALRALWDRLGLEVVSSGERVIDDRARPSYARQRHLAAFRRFRGTPIVFGAHLRPRPRR